MNKKFLNLMTAVLILMAAFASCDKNKGSGGSTGDNLFVGTWISYDDDGGILEVTETKWVMKSGNIIILKGDYTYKGKSANLTVTYVESGIELEAGDEGTAKISGDKLIVIFGGEEMVFTKSGEEDNSFVGTWISEDDEATLEVTETQWTMKYEKTTVLKGIYTYKGNSANLTVTYVIDEDEIGLTVGDVGTAKVSGDKMTVTFYGEVLVFTKEGGGDNGDTFVIEAKNVIGGNSDIATAAGMIEGDDDEYELASAPYKNNGFKLEVPATVANKYLWGVDNFYFYDICSDKNAKMTGLWLVAMDSDKDQLGEFYYDDEGYDYYAAADYMYVDRNLTIKGTIHDDEDYTTKWNCTLKKGWNVVYYFADSEWEDAITTTKPSGVNLVWNFWSDEGWKTPLMSPKHKNAGFEQSFFKNK